MNWRFVMIVAAVFMQAACGKVSAPVAVEFRAVVAGQAASCETPDMPALTDLRFYVHNLRLQDANGEYHSVQLDPGEWQQAGLALLDLENGGGSCLNGTAVTNDTVRGSVSGESFRALEFTLGVPFAANHGDPLLAEPPLGDADMHWHWRGGYKFLRAGLKNDTDSFWLHLGSTGCAGTIQNITGCSAPNRVVVRLENFTPGDVVLVDLAALPGAGALDDGVPTDCSSGPAEESCGAAFAALGLDHSTGKPAGIQQLFTLRQAP